MKINKKKFLYLISPNKIYETFYRDLTDVLKSKKISFFQLRLKKDNHKNKINISKKIKKICKKHKVKFLINDDPKLAKKINADGCHLGQKDMHIKNARKLLKNKIIGITCHNSIKLAVKAANDKADYIAFGAFNATKTKKVKFRANIKIARKILGKKIIGITCHNSINLAKKAIKAKADYIAFGAFNQSKTKKTRYTASIKILNKVKKFTKAPIVVIGGINEVNYKNLLLNKANFLAISGYIWKNKKYKPLQAIEKLK